MLEELRLARRFDRIVISRLVVAGVLGVKPGQVGIARVDRATGRFS